MWLLYAHQLSLDKKLGKDERYNKKLSLWNYLINGISLPDLEAAFLAVKKVNCFCAFIVA